jgi:hypothetical protein
MIAGDFANKDVEKGIFYLALNFAGEYWLFVTS